MSNGPAAPAPAVLDLVAAIETYYPITGGRDGFLSEPGGWIDMLGLTADDDLAAAAIDYIAAEEAADDLD